MVSQLWYDLCNIDQNEGDSFHFYIYDNFLNGGGLSIFLLNHKVLV